MSVYIDLTEFLRNPLLTGVQRVTAEICRRWPGGDLEPVRLEGSSLVRLPRELIPAIGEAFHSMDRSALSEIRRMRKRTCGVITDHPRKTILAPEVFYEPERVAFFRDLPQKDVDRYRFIVYDLLPWTSPEYFNPDISHEVIYGYLSVLRRFPRRAFISECTERIFRSRFLRSDESTSVVLRLGSDGLGEKPAQLADARPPHFCVVGTIEPRKNHALVLEAFEPLLRSVDGLRLTFLGRVRSEDEPIAAKLRWLAAGNCPGFTWIPDALDDCVRKHVESSRATIFVSSAEGFGLPPVESLWLGVPAIVSANLPSLEAIGTQGIEIVDPLGALTLRQAVSRFLADGFAELKAKEARALTLPTWDSFAREVAAWCA